MTDTPMPISTSLNVSKCPAPHRSKTGARMSALGQKQTLKRLHPDVRFTPKSGHC
jgi:hypothetical protein